MSAASDATAGSGDTAAFGPDAFACLIGADGALLQASPQGRALYARLDRPSRLRIHTMAAQSAPDMPPRAVALRAGGMNFAALAQAQLLADGASALLLEIDGQAPRGWGLMAAPAVATAPTGATVKNKPAPQSALEAMKAAANGRPSLRFVWKTDPDGVIAALSAAFLRAAPEAAGFIGKSWAELGAWLDKAAEIDAQARSGRAWSGLVATLRLDDGRLIAPLELGGAPMRDAAGADAGQRGYGFLRVSAALDAARPARASALDMPVGDAVYLAADGEDAQRDAAIDVATNNTHGDGSAGAPGAAVASGFGQGKADTPAPDVDTIVAARDIAPKATASTQVEVDTGEATTASGADDAQAVKPAAAPDSMPAAAPGLSVGERQTLRDIARALGARPVTARQTELAREASTPPQTGAAQSAATVVPPARRSLLDVVQEVTGRQAPGVTAGADGADPARLVSGSGQPLLPGVGPRVEPPARAADPAAARSASTPAPQASPQHLSQDAPQDAQEAVAGATAAETLVQPAPRPAGGRTSSVNAALGPDEAHVATGAAPSQLAEQGQSVDAEALGEADEPHMAGSVQDADGHEAAAASGPIAAPLAEQTSRHGDAVAGRASRPRRDPVAEMIVAAAQDALPGAVNDATPGAGGDAAAEAVRLLLQSAPVAAVVCRGEQVLHANQGFVALSRYGGAAEVMQVGLSTLLPEIAPHSRTARNATDRATLVGARGVRTPVLLARMPAPWRDGPAELILVIGDDSAEMEARARHLEAEALAHRERASELAAILDTATDGVLLLDGQGRILSLNRPAEALFGYEQNQLVGEPLTRLLDGESHQVALDYLASVRGGGVAGMLNDGREIVGRVRQGGVCQLFMTIGRVETATGLRFCAVLRDVTAWKQTEHDLIEKSQRAEAANAQKSDFLARMSHEVRTPLGAMIGFAELMLEERLGPIANPRYREYVRDIHESGQYVISLVNDLLDLARIEAGKVELTFASIDLNAVLTSCVTLMQPQAAKARIVLRSSLDADLPPVVADERSMRQIVLNVLGNALKFTDAGGQVIVSSLRNEAGEVVIRVRDTGIGMTEAETEEALKPFRRLARGRKTPGTGLGLPLTAALTEANRGALRINSRPGEGTLVEVALPTTRVLAH